MHKTIVQYLRSLRQQGKERTAYCYGKSLARYEGWCKETGIDPLKATVDDLRAYQTWLAEEYRMQNGNPLALGTQATLVHVVKGFYKWLFKRGILAVDLSRNIKAPRVTGSTMIRDYLTLQEAIAYLQTQSDKVNGLRKGCHSWAKEHRALALLCLTIATGRRRLELRNLKVQNLDFKRNEIRVERVKGKTGRVLPAKQWAMEVAKEYIEEARPVLDWEEGNDFVFVGEQVPRISNGTFNAIFEQVHKDTVEKNPDLTELPAKRITPHGLRVSFSKLLHDGKCNFRSINELLMHEQLSTTSRYVPVTHNDLRRMNARSHPRA